MPQHIRSSFVGDFKLGDNIVYNLKILKTLSEQRAAAADNQKNHYNKPITLICVSIIEAAIHDFLCRAKYLTLEGVPSLAKDIITYLREKDIDRFAGYIDQLKKINFFGNADYDIYKNLHNLRKLRNRIHIQNKKNHFERDDECAFNDARLRMSEECLEFTLRTLENHPRNANIGNHVEIFVLPFEQYFEKRDSPDGMTMLVLK